MSMQAVLHRESVADVPVVTNLHGRVGGSRIAPLGFGANQGCYRLLRFSGWVDGINAG
jgi:hypothetical protein